MWIAFAKGGGPNETEEFARIAEELKRDHGHVDTYFKLGQLGHKPCCLELELATFSNCHIEGEWSPEEVKEKASKARWEHEANTWATYSAKTFLETCARLGLSIQFWA